MRRRRIRCAVLMVSAGLLITPLVELTIKSFADPHRQVYCTASSCMADLAPYLPGTVTGYLMFLAPSITGVAVVLAPTAWAWRRGRPRR